LEKSNKKFEKINQKNLKNHKNIFGKNQKIIIFLKSQSKKIWKNGF